MVASITIDLQKLTENADKMVSMCAARGVEVLGVTKLVCGMPQVAQAMLEGGVTQLGDSRLENIQRLQRNGVDCPIMLLRIPALSEVNEIVQTINVSLNSELLTITALSNAALRHKRVHDIIIMIELGDRREGVNPEDFIALCDQVAILAGVRIVGIGTNLGCLGGVLPSSKNLGRLVDCAESFEKRYHRKLRYISGGNSSSLGLLMAGQLPGGINHLRIGASLLLGRNALQDAPLPGMHTDVFRLQSEVIEIKKKPSMPEGEIGLDAFGSKPVFENKGMQTRYIVSLGRLDVNPAELRATEHGATIIGASSDHLVLDMTHAQSCQVGGQLEFDMGYPAVLQAMISPYVKKRILVNRSQIDCSDAMPFQEVTQLLSSKRNHAFY